MFLEGLNLGGMEPELSWAIVAQSSPYRQLQPSTRDPALSSKGSQNAWLIREDPLLADVGDIYF